MNMRFTLMSGFFLYLFLLWFCSGMTYILNKWPIPGWTQLHNSVFGNVS